MIGEIQHQAARIPGGQFPDQAGDDEIVVKHRVVVVVDDLDLVFVHHRQNTFTVVESGEFRRVAVVVFHVRAEQMDDNELARRIVVQHLLERREDVLVVFARILRAAVVHVMLHIHMFGECGQHGIALGDGLLVGDPVGLVARLFHDVHQRRSGQAEVGVLLVGEGQHLFQ